MQVNFNIDSIWCLQQLLQDGWITQRDQDLIRTTPRRAEQQIWHALQWIAHFKLRSAQQQTLLTLNELCLWLAKKADLAFYSVDPLKLDIAALTEVMSQEFALKNHILAVELRSDQVWIATTQPFNRQWIPHLANSLKSKKIILVLIDPEQMQRYQAEFYSISQAIRTTEKQYDRALQRGDVINHQTAAEPDEQHVIQLLDWLLQFAFEQGASDIHLEPRERQGQVRFRIDGLLHHVYRMPMATFNAVVARLKILAQLNVAERRRPQDGRLRMGTAQHSRELRLSTLATAYGEKVVLRIFDPTLLLRNLSELGFDPDLLVAWQQLIQARNGMILVTGPTGSGKTTTLYSTLKQCATEQLNVCSIEDPIEMVEASFNQIQINPKIDLDFAEAIRALMRQDPDIIMVGEIRDPQTAQMAIQAALTGHLVFSTLHTQDAVSSLIRLQDLGVPPFLIAATLLGVLAQRLVRRLCPLCKQLAAVDVIKWQHLTVSYAYPQPEQLYQPQGCSHCRQTGFAGRIALYEFMPVTTLLKQRIVDRLQQTQLNEAIDEVGVLPLRIAAATKVLQGETSLDEVFMLFA